MTNGHAESPLRNALQMPSSLNEPSELSDSTTAVKGSPSTQNLQDFYEENGNVNLIFDF